MPIKRRASAVSPPKRAAHSPISEASVAPFLSADEKHQLILAHAMARKPPPDPAKRLSMWAGVVVCCILIVVAWGYTVGVGVKKLMAAPFDMEISEVIEKTKQLQEPLSADKIEEMSLVKALRDIQTTSSSRK